MNNNANDLVDSDLRATLAVMSNLATLSNETLEDFRRDIADSALAANTDPNVAVETVVLTSRDGTKVDARLYKPQRQEGQVPAPTQHRWWGPGHGQSHAGRHQDDRVGCDHGDCRPVGRLPKGTRNAVSRRHRGLFRRTPVAPQSGNRAGRRLRAPCAVRGASAGSGLAVGLAIMARDCQSPPIAFLWLLFPMLDGRTEEHPFAGKHVWPVEANRFGWGVYLGAQVDSSQVPVHAAVGRSENLSGLPQPFLRWAHWTCSLTKTSSSHAG